MITSELSPDKSKKNNGITNRLIYYFIFLLLISIAGFYKTYLVKFPNFEGFTFVHHFHGAVMLTWILMLIAQPVFIRTKKLKWHRIVGKASYFIFPLLVLSFFLVARASYFRNIKADGEIQALAGMTSGIPDMFFISILYGLGIYYKKKTSYFIFPLLVLSFFLVARAGYFRNIKAGSEIEALAGIPLVMPANA